MKLKLFFLALISGLFLNLKSQVFIAGNTLPGYTDIVPDTTIDYKVLGTSGFNQEWYQLNVFGTNNDLEIYAWWMSGIANKSAGIYAKPLNPNLMIRYSRWDSVYSPNCSCWFNGKIAKPLSLGDTINSANAIWDTMQFFTKFAQSGGGPQENVLDWVGTSDKYLGLRFFNGTSYEYGWLRVNVPAAQKCKLLDYSSSSGVAGIKLSEADKGAVFPNPFVNEIHLENLVYENIQLFDCLSREIKINSEVSGDKTKIMVDPELPNGIYYLKISGKNGAFSKKFIRS